MKVVVVDMASVFGGHAVMASGDLCIVGTPDQAALGLKDTPDLAYGDFVAWGEDPSPEWVRYYVDHSRREIYDWVASMGVTFGRLSGMPANSVMRLHRTKGKRWALVTPIYQACLADPDITFVWNLRVDRRLVTDQRIAGVAVTNLRTGAASEIRGRAVVLVTGGFQSNLDMVRVYWPKGLNFPRNLFTGSGIHSAGSGLGLAQKTGAALAPISLCLDLNSILRQVREELTSHL